MATTAEFTKKEDKMAQEYYDNDDSFNFYKLVWGGDNLHVGVYQGLPASMPALEQVAQGSVHAMEKLLSKRPIARGSKLMDMGAAYGGVARYAVEKYNCFVSCVEISRMENERNAEMTKEAGMDRQIFIGGERSFYETGEEDASYDTVISEDCFVYAGAQRQSLFDEIARVLRPGGYLIFTDIMQTADADPSLLKAVYERVNVPNMGSVAAYKECAAKAGLVLEDIEIIPGTVQKHYGLVKEAMLGEQAKGVLRGKVSDAFVEKMAFGLDQWVLHGSKGALEWGYFVFRKPAVPATPVDSRVDCSKVYVKESPLGGDGAFAAVDIKKGEEVERGIVRRLPLDGNQSPFVFTWSEDRTVWASGSGCSVFYNTADEPNTHMERYFDEDRFTITALRDIKRGEELTHMYRSKQWRQCFEDLRQ